MNQTDFQAAIARLAQHKIGPHESAALFAIAARGSTVPEIAKLCHAKPALMRVRLAVLVDKGLVSREVERRGVVTFFVSEDGQKIITNTLGTP